jgi:hypothetical protein
LLFILHFGLWNKLIVCASSVQVQFLHFITKTSKKKQMLPVARLINRVVVAPVYITSAGVRSFGTSIPVILMKDMDAIKATGDEYYAGGHGGKKGDIITVKRGYARNFLIPRYYVVFLFVCLLAC